MKNYPKFFLHWFLSTSFKSLTTLKNILYQVDLSGNHSHVLDGIIDCKSDSSAVTKENAFVVTKRGKRSLRQTTIGWKFQVLWKDGTKQWIPLKVMKESNPVEVAEFVTARGIADEPAFAWWVPFTLKKRDCIIAAVNSRVIKRTHKFGLEVPRSIEHALQQMATPSGKMHSIKRCIMSLLPSRYWKRTSIFLLDTSSQAVI